jgi:hypothetical protein
MINQLPECRLNSWQAQVQPFSQVINPQASVALFEFSVHLLHSAIEGATTRVWSSLRPGIVFKRFDTIEYFRLMSGHLVNVTEEPSKGNLSLSVQSLFVIFECSAYTEADVTLIMIFGNAN